jgi:hypothetical protein
MFSKLGVAVGAVVFAACGVGAYAQHPIEPRGAARPANGDGVYRALRTAGPMGEGVRVKEFTLEREGGIFHFTDGAFYLYGAVNGRETGAVFLGHGRFELAPKEASEQHSLALLTKSGVMSQEFSTVVLRFSDDTAEEIRKASAGSAGPLASQASGAASGLAKEFRTTLHENFDLRLLGEVTAGPEESKRERFFLASFRMGGSFTGRNVLFKVDPERVPDQVELTTWDSSNYDTWAAYKRKDAAVERGVPLHVSEQVMDVRMERSGKMTNAVETTITMRRGGLRVLPLNLYPTLRVSGVYDGDGDPLDFVQEDKEYDPQFAIVLPKPVAKGATLHVLTKYSGPDAVRRDGDGMYYLRPGARESWYPAGDEALGGFANYRMTFHIPKNLDIVATGKRVSSEKEDGGQKVVWATDTPIAVAGFNLGEFDSTRVKTPQGFEVLAYANTELPDSMKGMEGGTMGSMEASSALKYELSQGSTAIQVYSEYFGKLPYDHVALTEQSACGFGQSWPMLVYLPVCAFFDDTVKHQMGLLQHDPSYWEEVTPHEVAHQWWGQEVGFDSYRDQWMSEGFANFSVSLYLVATNKDLKPFNDFWKEQKKNLVEKNAMGVRPIDAGPLTMGQRVANEKTGNVYQDLIYSKGAYVMHMLQVMYWTPKEGEAPFKHSMQEFVKEYAGKAASTEDLKASFERTMPPCMNVAHDGKLDWFFNEYVYGTELPHYDVASDFTVENGETTMHFKVTQSHVSDSFLMILPLYLQMQDGHTPRLFNLSIKGNSTVERTVKLGKVPSPAKKLIANYYEDILSN